MGVDLTTKLVEKPSAIKLKTGDNNPRNTTLIVVRRDQKHSSYILDNAALHEDGTKWKFTDPVLKSEIELSTAEHFLLLQRITKTKRQEVYNEIKDKTIEEVRALFADNTQYAKPDVLKNEIKENNQLDQKKLNDFNQIVQMQINAVKYQQSKQFKTYIDTANEFSEIDKNKQPITIYHENDKDNIVGNSQTAFAALLNSGHKAKDLQTFNDCEKLFNPKKNDNLKFADKQFKTVKSNIAKTKQFTSDDKHLSLAELGAQYTQTVSKAEDAKNTTFQFTSVVSPEASPFVTKPDLKVSIQVLSSKEMKAIREGIQLTDNQHCQLSMRYDSEKKQLDLAIYEKKPKEGQKVDEAEATKALKESAVKLIVAAFQNSVADKPIIISGNNPELVSYCHMVAEEINDHLPKDQQKKLKINSKEMDADYNATADKKALLAQEIENNGSSFNFKDKEWKNFLSQSSDIKAEDRDQIYTHTIKP